ncbi:MAG TPA: alanine racemase [Candidatus Hydrogenedentes bacterium]|nr:alanine racemase [Candidatus Hydrogenedentota bacterium]
MQMASPTRAIVDLAAYSHNLSVVQRLIPRNCAIQAVVKADGYGHGAIPVARRAVEYGVEMLGVATVNEGIALREAGITAPILVLGQPPPDGLIAAVVHDLRLMISDTSAAERVGEHARRANKVLPIHCKIDSGMGRQGFDIDSVTAELEYLTRISNIDIEGIATHFPVADAPDDDFTLNQIRLFKQLLRQLDKIGIPYETAHAANSAAIINYPTSAFDMVRPGLMTYGVWPTGNRPEGVALHPALRWEARITLVKELEAGSSVGYGRTYKSENHMRAAVIPVGYADGYKYGLGNRADVLIRGKRCPVRGSVSMDQIVVDVSEVQNVSAGDTAVLVGTDGNEWISVEELAERAQTVPYDILTGIGPRVERVYVN